MISPSISSGARIFSNILDFEQCISRDAKVIKLEQNYRSTGKYPERGQSRLSVTIRGVRRKHSGQLTVKGNRFSFQQFDTAYEEADVIVAGY